MTWREIEDFEKTYLRALGSALRSLRRHAGLSQAAVAEHSGVHPRTIGRIEAGQRRTRRSTLRRILIALTNADGSLGDIEYLLDGLVRRAGPALAAESPYEDRIEARRRRRERRREREWLRAMAVADEAERIAHLYIRSQVVHLRRHGRLT